MSKYTEFLNDALSDANAVPVVTPKATKATKAKATTATKPKTKRAPRKPKAEKTECVKECESKCAEKCAKKPKRAKKKRDPNAPKKYTLSKCSDVVIGSDIEFSCLRQKKAVNCPVEAIAHTSRGVPYAIAFCKECGARVIRMLSKRQVEQYE